MNQIQVRDIYNDNLIDPAFSAYFDPDEYLTGQMTDEYYTIKHHNEILNKFKLDRLNEMINNFLNFNTVNDELIEKLEPLLIKKFSKDEDRYLHFGDHEQEKYLEEQYNNYYRLQTDEIDKLHIEEYENHFLNEFKDERYDELEKLRCNLHRYNYFVRVFKAHYKKDYITNLWFPNELYNYIKKIDKCISAKLKQ